MAARSREARADDYHRRVADALIQQIRRGTAPWTRAWEPGGRALPANLKTGQPYRGGNSIWLASTAQRRGYADERWGTYRQVRDAGGQVRRGEKGCAILYWQFEARQLVRNGEGEPQVDANGRPVYETRPLPSPRVYQYTVFNAEQCDGLPARPARPGAAAWDRHEELERVLAASGAQVEQTGSDRAYYDLPRDRIVLPYRERFPTAPAYYQTALHEYGHWTGHPDRLNRATLRQGTEEGFHSAAYAREELRAEISSMMTGDRLGIGHDPGRHAAYVGAWIKALKEDPREVYRASRDAQEMSDYLLERGRERNPERAGRAVGAVPAPAEERTEPLRPPAPERLPLFQPERRIERAPGPER